MEHLCKPKKDGVFSFEEFTGSLQAYYFWKTFLGGNFAFNGSFKISDHL